MQLNSYIFSGDCSVTQLDIDSGTPQELNLMKLSRRDGAKLISSNFAPKEITIGGILKGTSVANLEANIDTFKQNVMITNGNLDLSYAGTSRRYTVDCSACTVSREYFHTTFAPFELKLIASDPPFGQDLSVVGGDILMTECYSANDQTANMFTANIDIDGSVAPNPIITYDLDSIGNLDTILFYNRTTFDQISITTGWHTGDSVIINTGDRTVQKNLNNVEFEGVFPEFNLGNNNIQTSISVLNTLLVDSSAEGGVSEYGITVDNTLGMSFTVPVSGNYDRFDFLLRKLPITIYTDQAYSDDLTVRIETDNSNEPSGTLVDANATKIMLNSSFSTSLTWMTVNFTEFALTSGTKYWIKFTTSQSGAGGLSYKWREALNNSYANGNLASYHTLWTQYGSVDMNFRIYSSTAFTGKIDEHITYNKRYL